MTIEEGRSVCFTVEGWKKLIGIERDIVIADVLAHFEIWSKESWNEELLKLTDDLEAKQWD